MGLTSVRLVASPSFCLRLDKVVFPDDAGEVRLDMEIHPRLVSNVVLFFFQYNPIYYHRLPREPLSASKQARIRLCA